jgi:phosphohistidine phosphatase SixA
MKLQKLIVVRHGYYSGENLTSDGRRRVAGLAEVLASQLNGHTVALLSSTAIRARETSEILVASLGGIPFDEHRCFHSGGNYLEADQVTEALRLVDEKGMTHEVVILSTHMEFIDRFPTIWGRRRGFSINEQRDTPKGSARMINVQTGEVEDLYPAR